MNRRGLRFVVVFVAMIGLFAWADEPDLKFTTVGVLGRIDSIVLPGSELRTLPLPPDNPLLVLRIAATYRHGSSHRYDLEYYGLEPGTYDLYDFMERVDGTPLDGVQPILVEIQSVLPPGQFNPHTLEGSSAGSFFRYGIVAALAGLAWLMVLIALLTMKGTKPIDKTPTARCATLAELLQPRLQAASEGKLDRRQYAELERMLVELWRRRLGLEQSDPASTFHQLRAHPEAGPILRQLESWMHDPRPLNTISLADLVRPYRDWPSEELGTWDEQRSSAQSLVESPP